MEHEGIVAVPAGEVLSWGVGICTQCVRRSVKNGKLDHTDPEQTCNRNDWACTSPDIVWMRKVDHAIKKLEQ